MGESSFPQFIGCICDYLSIIMEANCESNEVPVFNHTISYFRRLELVRAVSLSLLAVSVIISAS